MFAYFLRLNYHQYDNNCVILNWIFLDVTNRLEENTGIIVLPGYEHVWKKDVENYTCVMYIAYFTCLNIHCLELLLDTLRCLIMFSVTDGQLRWLRFYPLAPKLWPK